MPKLQSAQIAAFIDSQGFSYGADDGSSCFVPLELTFVGEGKCDHITYDVYVPFDIAGGKLKTYMYQSKKIHGIPLKRGLKSTVTEVQLKLRDDLAKLCAQYLTVEKPILAVNNVHLFKIMREMDIKVTCLPFNSKYPKLEELDRKYKSTFVCELHDSNPAIQYRCSKRKAQHYYIWLTGSSMVYS